MIKIEEIVNAMGDVWVSRVQEKAKHIYDRMQNRDLSKREFINSYVRHTYSLVQEQRQGAD